MLFVPQSLLAVSDWRAEHAQGWVRVESVVDSGASAPVAPLTMAPGHETRQSRGSMEGRSFSDASGGELRNLGEQELNIVTDAGMEAKVLFQLADITRPLMSVSSICDRGNRVLFGRGGGVIQNLTTGQEIPFERRGGIYVIGMWIKDKGNSATAAADVPAPVADGHGKAIPRASGFTRR